ncbi:PAS domain-containing sensor histidine kinase [Fibrella aquatica]|uniref:PAS domain-containing sensor histidine kinase n=1 Tax=Fibrella aquatica TaxID=3242487 RepID=UPI003521A77C
MNPLAPLPPDSIGESVSSSLALIQNVLDASLNGMAAYGAIRTDGVITDLRVMLLNRVAADDAQRSLSDLVGKSLTALSPNLIASPLFDRVVRVLDTGIPDRFILPLKTPGVGGLRQFDTALTLIGDLVLVSYNDVTDRYQAEKSSQLQTDRLRFVTDNALTAIALYSIVRDPVSHAVVDFRYEFVNRMAERMVNKSADELIGKTMRQAFPGIDQTAIWKAYLHLAETGETLRLHNHYTLHNFDIWYEVQGVRENDHIVLSFLDITPIKKAELDRQQQKDLVDSLLSNLPVMFVLFTAVRDQNEELIDFEVLQANQAAADSLGFPLSELVGKRLTSITPTIKNGPMYAEYVRVYETGEPTQFERQHGDQWYQISVVKFNEGFIASFVDVTESRLYRQQLEAMNQELLRSNDSLQQFAYVASHDLQEPLRKIQAFGDLLGEQYGAQLDQFGQDAVSRMQSAATRMSLLITDLLTYSRISTNRKPFQPVDLDQILTDVLGDLEVRIQETQAIIDRTPLPVIAGDPTLLRQLFQNLLSNALKFQAATNEVNYKPHVQIDCQQELIDGRMWYYISISDNGIGFEPKYADRIFQVFQRLHGKKSYAGTGVGLAICKRVVDSHGGTITATSKPGEGATFNIRIPG